LLDNKNAEAHYYDWDNADSVRHSDKDFSLERAIKKQREISQPSLKEGIHGGNDGYGARGEKGINDLRTILHKQCKRIFSAVLPEAMDSKKIFRAIDRTLGTSDFVVGEPTGGKQEETTTRQDRNEAETGIFFSQLPFRLSESYRAKDAPEIPKRRALSNENKVRRFLLSQAFQVSESLLKDDVRQERQEVRKRGDPIAPISRETQLSKMQRANVLLSGKTHDERIKEYGKEKVAELRGTAHS
jgi:hypothetical protein